VIVTSAVLVDVQPDAPITVSEYVVVVVGLARGEQLCESSSPVAGIHKQLAAPEPESTVEEPMQIVAEPLAAAVGGGTTVIVNSLEVIALPKPGVVVSTR
jgi:hypothetical protein